MGSRGPSGNFKGRSCGARHVTTLLSWSPRAVSDAAGTSTQAPRHANGGVTSPAASREYTSVTRVQQHEISSLEKPGGGGGGEVRAHHRELSACGSVRDAEKSSLSFGGIFVCCGRERWLRQPKAYCIPAVSHPRFKPYAGRMLGL